MKINKTIFLFCLLINVSIDCKPHSNAKHTKPKHTSSKQHMNLRNPNSKYTILCGIKDVLLEIDIGAVPGGWIGYFIGFTPQAVEQELYDVLKLAQIDTRKVPTFGPASFYSPLLCHWLHTPNSSEFVRSLAEKTISEHCWFLQKNRLLTAAQIAFTPEKTSYVFKPNKPFIEILKKCKQRDHRLVLCANWNKESFDELVKKHHEAFLYFETFYTSGNIGMLTFEKPFFKKMLESLNATPQECILIDQREETIHAAKNAQIKVITYSSAAQVQRELEKIRII